MTSVRGGLVLTAKLPMNPAATLPAPTATRSWLNSPAAGVPGPARRTHAAVCARHRNAAVAAGATRCPASDHDPPGHATLGRPPGNRPTTLTPWATSPA